MVASVIPSTLINAKVYNSGKTMLGIATAEIGDLEFMSESIAGELELPVLGHFKSLGLNLNWNSVCDSAMELLVPKSHQLSIYASIQNWQYDDGNFAPAPCRVNCLAFPRKSGIGKFEPGKKMEPGSEFELTFLKMAINGRDVLEIDKVNFICMINGVDYLANVRMQLGQ